VAQGYRADGSPAPPWPLFAWAGADGLRSTARDMLAFGEACLGHPAVDGVPVPATLGQAVQVAMQPIWRPHGKTFEQAMAWEIHPAAAGAPSFAVKSGATAGFTSAFVVVPAKDLAVFVAANKAGADAERLAVEIARQIP
jgi:CubicO group peptidase (beta-lactamase class C family)